MSDKKKVSRLLLQCFYFILLKKSGGFLYIMGIFDIEVKGKRWKVIQSLNSSRRKKKKKKQPKINEFRILFFPWYNGSVEINIVLLHINLEECTCTHTWLRHLPLYMYCITKFPSSNLASVHFFFARKKEFQILLQWMRCWWNARWNLSFFFSWNKKKLKSRRNQKVMYTKFSVRCII